MEDDTNPDDTKTVGEVSRWVKEIEIYDKETQDWRKKGKDIVRRYKDERKPTEEGDAKFNLLWSNVQTLSPALFAKNPTANIDRRNVDTDDDIARYAGEVLERCVSYYIDEKYFDTTQQCVLDRLLPGRGTAWVRYVPTFEVTDDEETGEQLKSEEIKVDYIHWRDFGHTWARTPAEIRAVWRIVYMDRQALVKRFGAKIGNAITLDYTPKGEDGDKIDEASSKATIYEIWDKTSLKAMWLHKTYKDLLDEKDDPLGLKDFFPCPMPLFASTANDTCIPTPDYVQYQDQADLLDELTGRIFALQKAVKVVGIYDAKAEGIDRILAEGLDNVMVPVDQFALMGEKGIAGLMAFLPISEVAEALKGLIELREKIKQDAFEISGMSDILRGQGDPNETATGVKTKGAFATLRLNSMQGGVARFCRDSVKIMAEIIAMHYSLDTIKKISGVQLLMAQEKAIIQQYMQAQGQQQPGMPPMMPLPPELQELVQDQDKLAERMADPTWEEVYGLLQNDTMFCFRIDIETNSTIKMDQEEEKQSKTELITAVTGFIQQAATIQDPIYMPFMTDLLMFGIRAFGPASRDIETAGKLLKKQLQQKAENPQPPPQDPAIQLEAMKQQSQQQMAQAQIQHEQMLASKDQQFEAAKAQSDLTVQQSQFAHERQLADMKMQHDQNLAGIKAELEKVKLQHASTMAAHDASTQGAQDAVQHSHEHVMAAQQQQHDAKQAKQKPKKAE